MPCPGRPRTAAGRDFPTYYTLTAAGRKQLAAEREEFDRLITAIRRVLQTA